MPDDVHFCYRCGRPVGPGAGKCLFCGSPTRREIRPPRRCRYCDEPVRHKALKCHHCGEYLDEAFEKAEKEKTAQPQQAGPTFVIEKAVIQDSGHLLTEGEGGAAGRAIEQAPLRGIEGPRRALEGPAEGEGGSERPKALPEPSAGDDDEIQDASYSRIDTPEGGGSDSKDLIRRSDQAPGGGDISPTLYEGPGGGLGGAGRELVLSTAKKAVGFPIRAAAGLAPRLAGLFGVGPEARGGREASIEVDAESEEDRYRACDVCGSEILTLDNYCFHCGQTYHGGEFDPKPHRTTKSNAGVNTLAVLSVVLFYVAPRFLTDVLPENSITPVVIGAAIAAPLFGLWGVLRPAGVLGRLISFGFLLASIAAIYLFYGVE